LDGEGHPKGEKKAAKNVIESTSATATDGSEDDFEELNCWFNTKQLD